MKPNKLCRFCLEKVAFVRTQEGYFKCPKCKEEERAVLYVNEYDKYPSVVFTSVGFSGHGKSVYLASLFMTLWNELPESIDRMHPIALDDDAVKQVHENMALLRRGALPEASPTHFQRPALVRVFGLPGVRDHTFVIYDTGGENFQAADAIRRNVGFLKHAKSALFLVSLTDLGSQAAAELHRLLNVYVNGRAVLANGEPVTKQNLVVAFTKLDSGQDPLGQQPWVAEYLRSWSPKLLVDRARYREDMDNVSRRVRHFLDQEVGAKGFLNLADVQFAQVRFCVLSSLGAPPTQKNGTQKLGVVPAPRRTIDPLLWMLEFESKPAGFLSWLFR